MSRRPSRGWRGVAALSGFLWLAVNASTAAEIPSPTQSSLTNLAELPLEQLGQIPIESVAGASRYEQKVTHAPSSVSIVTADEIKKFGYRTLADVLRSVGGLYVDYDRNYSYLAARGFRRPGDYNSRVLLLVDGHRVNDDVYDSWLMGTDAIVDVDLIDRVEVIRGPSSSIYGNNAFFGVVNVLTRRGRQMNGAEASAEAGSFGTYAGRFSYGGMFTNGVEMLLSGSWYDSAGQRNLYFREFDSPDTNHGLARDRDGDEAQHAQASLSYRDFTLSGAFSQRKKDVPTASYGTVFNDGREATTDLRAYADLKYQHEFSEDTTLMARVSYDHYSYQGIYPYDYAAPGAPPDLVLNKDDNWGDWITTEWQVTQRVFDRHTLVLGAEYRENLLEHQANYDLAPPYVYELRDHADRNAGVFAQAEIAILTNLTLNAGVRYDYYDTFGGTVNPRAGLIYQPWTRSTFKLLYGQAFRAPNEYELSYQTPASPPLVPEDIRTYELVYEQSLAKYYRLTASGYYYQIDHLISSPGGAEPFANIDQAEARGAELELEGRYPSGVLARLSYALQRAEDARTHVEFPDSPRHMAKFNFIVPLYQDKVFSGLEFQYMSGLRTMANHETDNFLVANLTLFSQKVFKGLEISASLYNLLDSRYGYPGTQNHREDVIYQDGRSFRLKLTYKF